MLALGTKRHWAPRSASVRAGSGSSMSKQQRTPKRTPPQANGGSSAAPGVNTVFSRSKRWVLS